MDDFLLVVWTLRWHIALAFIAGWIVTRAVASDYQRGYPPPQQRVLHVAPVATHGPWSDHASGCRCLVCK